MAEAASSTALLKTTFDTFLKTEQYHGLWITDNFLLQAMNRFSLRSKKTISSNVHASMCASTRHFQRTEGHTPSGGHEAAGNNNQSIEHVCARADTLGTGSDAAHAGMSTGSGLVSSGVSAESVTASG